MGNITFGDSLNGSDHDYLSNSYPCSILFHGKEWPSACHCFLAQFPKCSASEAQSKVEEFKDRIRVLTEEQKASEMEKILHLKFTQNKDLHQKFKAKLTYEGNDWGSCNNLLGKLLMRVRTDMDTEIALCSSLPKCSNRLTCKFRHAEICREFNENQNCSLGSACKKYHTFVNPPLLHFSKEILQLIMCDLNVHDKMSVFRLSRQSVAMITPLLPLEPNFNVKPVISAKKKHTVLESWTAPVRTYPHLKVSCPVPLDLNRSNHLKYNVLVYSKRPKEYAFFDKDSIPLEPEYQSISESSIFQDYLYYFCGTKAKFYLVLLNDFGAVRSKGSSYYSIPKVESRY